jgi:sugar/nucleoside kinase (ribokinase family)
MACSSNTRCKDRVGSAFQVLDKLPDARGVLVTAGGDGCSFSVRTDSDIPNSGSVSVYEVDVQDTTGAGDAFTCGFLAYLLAEVRSCARATRISLRSAQDQ